MCKPHLVDQTGGEKLPAALAPPASEMSRPPAARRASVSAASMPSVTKWNVVPPLQVSGARRWWVSTKTGQ